MCVQAILPMDVLAYKLSLCAHALEWADRLSTGAHIACDQASLGYAGCCDTCRKESKKTGERCLLSEPHVGHTGQGMVWCMTCVKQEAHQELGRQAAPHIEIDAVEGVSKGTRALGAQAVALLYVSGSCVYHHVVDCVAALCGCVFDRLCCDRYLAELLGLAFEVCATSACHAKCAGSCL